MTSQLNNSNENQDQMLQETDTLRPVFFDLASSRGSVSVGASSETKRARLDASVITSKDHHNQVSRQEVPSHDDSSAGPHDTIPLSLTPLDIDHHNHHNHHSELRHRHMLLQHHILTGGVAASGGGGVGSVTSSEMSASKFSPADASMPALSSSSNMHICQLPGDGKGVYESLFGRKNSASRHSPIGKKTARLPPVSSTVAANLGKSPKYYRRFRSRSLPIINYTSRAHLLQQQLFPSRPSKGISGQHGGIGVPTLDLSEKAAGLSTSSSQHKPSHSLKNLSSRSSAAPSLPPINLQSLKEIDLQEILKNPQLRHDILFDPQLQFRPNLDGDRGRRKKSVIERYWTEIEIECKQFFVPGVVAGAHPAKICRLPALFTTLRDILLSLLPAKDRTPVNEIMDMELVVQQFSRGSFDFVAMAHWLGEVFKSHCAPMRDQWVSEMIAKFEEASHENSVTKLVQGLRSIFSILEAMKLDVANHQIRILRPVLIETAVDFERDYFNQLISHCKIDIADSLKWFYKNYQKSVMRDSKKETTVDECRSILASSIIDLLSCRNMSTEFPSTLAFDHTRLILLRADVRQLVCVQLCIVLFKQLISNYELAVPYKAASLQADNVTRVQEEILAIVTDEHGNVKWTRNIRSIAIQLVKNVVNDPNAQQQSNKLPQPLIDFSYNWLLKQIQPSSEVYGLMEGKIFKDLIREVGQHTSSAPSSKLNTDFKFGGAKPEIRNKRADSEMAGISNRISTLMNFHWNVFGDYYLEYIQNQS